MWQGPMWWRRVEGVGKSVHKGQGGRVAARSPPNVNWTVCARCVRNGGDGRASPWGSAKVFY